MALVRAEAGKSTERKRMDVIYCAATVVEYSEMSEADQDILNNLDELIKTHWAWKEEENGHKNEKSGVV